MDLLDATASPLPSGQNESSQDHSAESSAPPSRGGTKPLKEKHKVQWNSAGETQDNEKKKSIFKLPSDDSSEGEDPVQKPLPKQRIPPPQRNSSAGAVLQGHSRGRSKSPSAAPNVRLKPPILKRTHEGMRAEQGDSKIGEGDDATKSAADGDGEEDPESIAVAAGKEFSQQSARKRAERLERNVGIHSAPVSRHTSPVRTASRIPLHSPPKTPPPSPPLQPRGPNLDLSGYALEELATRRTYGSHENDLEDNTDDDRESKPAKGRIRKKFHAAARRLLLYHTQKDPKKWFRVHPEEPILRSGQSTPNAERDPDDYVPRPKSYREGVLGSLMKLYNEPALGPNLDNTPSGSDMTKGSSFHRFHLTKPLLDSGASTPALIPGPSPTGSPDSSGAPSPGTSVKAKPTKWYKNQKPHSTGSIADLVSSSTSLAQPGGSRPGTAIRPIPKHRPRSVQAMDAVLGRQKGPRVEEAIRIHMHVADVMQRKAYLLKICRALMAYGAPTHRLEEYMRMSARVLEIDSHFLYMPGCMIISFGDAAWHTTDVRIVRCIQGVNLSKLYDAHAIYKEVIHDMIGVEEAIERLDKINGRNEKFPKWWLVFVYGLASACVGPFAFSARPIDLPIAFVLGCLLGFMQLVLAPRSDLYANIFEISAAVLTSFLARAFGSINHGNTFCFSALAQSSIALILPGYTVLCGSLELQSKNIVAGSVRMVYAIIYSLFLGFGITVGTSIYGAIDSKATSSTTCQTTWPFWWEAIFVLPFTLCLIIINQGKWQKMPPMLVLAMIGYLVNHYSAQRFSSNAQIAQTLGALAIGVVANLYSRLRHGLAAAILLPAIFVQVPSGLAASGSLISGVTSANQITNHTGGYSSGVTTVNNGTQASGGGNGVEINSAVLNVGYSMIQIAIGITVGLFMSALVVYPFGKRRSGLFSF